MNTASTISQRDAYKLMLKDYPDVMSIEQMCEILSISTKTGYRILREGKILSLKVGRAYRIPKAHLFTFALFCRSSVLLDFPTDFPTNFCYACFCSVAMINLAISGFSCSSR